MSIEKISLREFTEKVSDRNPTPGGGAVSAFVGSLAASLVEMVANLTLLREDYSEWHTEMERVIELMEETRVALLESVDLDIKAFDEVMNAYRLPKSTNEEKERRTQAIQEALKAAAHVPYETCRHLKEIAKCALIVAKWGNVNAISDAISAAELAMGSFYSARANVLINLKSIKDEDFKNNMLHELKTFAGEMEGALKSVRQIASERAKILF
ncbi:MULTISPECIES: cyclodeaminase/cyclohydrolase family protein [Pseudothermotoga]|jgi:formiminotetrahydrofolate cyclodeaminase|uniref:Formiminotransferase-cyclodeaminase n=1 Tax=Pseudothermotoga lettingae (strain ATCC BAA-301 / DSM 14385 / NBRC 107922 / TMO) TaxID=416591 RepID=A8F4C8_PSELT|nr:MULTISPECIES: cyclodeaminase/cyclohydrolase family protein [Pseudothermotoga]ABV33012.1 Formiminotransferase-cyclodeaminase [Pseudothermotoga lettingae TMO]MDI3494208.1 methenyltetrahydrofolate cyclohydrolase [Pseudothermotoga sp.]MDK2884018.1 methenyltetrahydrofolate cyclohydrolase [Pseudothermotoga sp.]GLI47986.1 formiminotransferase-cyclodeaminase [Pseudothermotoga lettingae TMO]